MNHKDFLDIPGRQDEEMNAAQLKLGYWIATHRAALRITGVGLIVAFDVFFGAYAIYGWTSYFLGGYFTDQKDAAALVQSAGTLNTLVAERAAAPLNVEGTTAYASATDRFDAVALVQNPNKDWYASFDYAFDAAGTAHDFLLPGDERPVGIFDVAGTSAGAPNFTLSHIQWRRISRHDIPDVTSWLAARNQFDITNIKITSASDLGLFDGRLEFDITNQTFFDYRDPEFMVGVWNGPTLARVYKIHTGALKAGESSHIAVAIPTSVPVGATVRLYPHIDFFDASVYLK